MKKLFSIILGLVCAAGLVFAVSGCDKEDGEATNTMTLRGNTFSIDYALFTDHGEITRLHVHTPGDEGLSGFGEVPSSWIGKTTKLEGEFFLSFNPQSGAASIDPEIKSGTVKITKVEKKLHVVVDAVEESGDKFKMDYLAEDEESFNARQ